MKSTPASRGNDDAVPLEAVLRTEELQRRPSRPRDYAKENRALLALVQALSDSPRTILQTLSDLILEVFEAGSAGVSLLTTDDGGKRFYWPAIAGVWKPHIGGGTPRNFGPCGDVLDRNAPLLFTHFERRYPYLAEVTPQVEECLLIPFFVHGKAVGTIWAMAHDDRRQFDAEDLRLLESLGRFASAAYQALVSLNELDSHRAALNLMEDAVLAKEALRESHEQLRAYNEELTLFNRVAVGRELRMIELKREVNDFCERLGQPARYSLEFDQEADPPRRGLSDAESRRL
jgi:GAF domain-containing protein